MTADSSRVDGGQVDGASAGGAAKDSQSADARRRQVRAGIAWMVLTTAFFVTQDATMRVLMQTYPVTEATWARFAVHTLFAAILLGWRGPYLFRSRRPTTQIVRSALLLAVTILSVLSLHIMPFAEVQAIVAVVPVLVTALSVPLLGETVGWRRWLGVLGGLAGALTIIGPASSMFHWAVLLPLSSAACNAVYQIVTRKLKGSDPPLTTFFYTGTMGTLLLLPTAPFGWVMPDATGLTLMILVGLMGGISHYCMIRAYTAASASTVAPFGYTTLVWAALYAVMLFGEDLRTTTIIGASMIVVSGLYIFYREQARGKT